MNGNIWLYILVTALVTYLIRVTPLVLIRREITNPIIRSFLFYVPYVTLAVMTFPAIIEATQSIWSGLGALARGPGRGRLPGPAGQEPVPGGGGQLPDGVSAGAGVGLIPALPCPAARRRISHIGKESIP